MSFLLLANENIPLASIKALRIAGFDVLAIVESYHGENDRKVLSVAAGEQRILITFDRDYGELIFKERSLFRRRLFIRVLNLRHRLNLLKFSINFS